MKIECALTNLLQLTLGHRVHREEFEPFEPLDLWGGSLVDDSAPITHRRRILAPRPSSSDAFDDAHEHRRTIEWWEAIEMQSYHRNSYERAVSETHLDQTVLETGDAMSTRSPVDEPGLGELVFDPQDTGHQLLRWQRRRRQYEYAVEVERRMRERGMW